MKGLARHVARAAVPLTLAAVALLPVGAASAAPDGACPCLVVHRPDGSDVTLTAKDVQDRADVHDTQYETRAVPGGATQAEPYVGTGLSVRAALVAAGLDPSGVGFTALTRPDGSWTTLSGRDLASPSGFDRGLLPAVRVDGSVLEYVRPLRADARDTNAEDLLRDSSLRLEVHTGRLLQVSPRATPQPVRPHDAAQFAADVGGGPGPFAERWAFGDGGSASGADPQHAYDQAGRYTALVHVDGPDDSAGVGRLTVAVGTAPSGAGGRGGEGGRRPASGSAGRAPERGHPATPQAHPGAAAPPVGRRVTASRHPGAAPTGPGARPTTGRAPRVARQAAHPALPTPRAPLPAPATAVRVSPPGPTVRGLLLDPAAAVAAQPAAAATSAAGAGTTGRPSGLTGPAAALSAAVLLGLGALAEARPRRRRS